MPKISWTCLKFLEFPSKFALLLYHLVCYLLPHLFLFIFLSIPSLRVYVSVCVCVCACVNAWVCWCFVISFFFFSLFLSPTHHPAALIKSHCPSYPSLESPADGCEGESLPDQHDRHEQCPDRDDGCSERSPSLSQSFLPPPPPPPPPTTTTPSSVPPSPS